jgi:hypothetical protein
MPKVDIPSLPVPGTGQPQITGSQPIFGQNLPQWVSLPLPFSQFLHVRGGNLDSQSFWTGMVKLLLKRFWFNEVA